MFPKTTRILIVDDMSTMRLRIMNQLRVMGFGSIYQASNGQEAFSILERHAADGKPIDLIISDWNMPVMSGLDFLVKVKAEKSFSQLPFIMATAEGEKQQVMRAVVSGVTDYIIKPIDREVLQKKLVQLWEREQKAASAVVTNKAAC